MPIRLVITTYAKPGKGTELAQAMADRCRAVQPEPGCQQYEVFQSALAPDKFVLLEIWADQAALDAHAQRNATRPPNAALVALRADGTRPREDYIYNRTRQRSGR
jgi:quinol monooxygenase YgiN